MNETERFTVGVVFTLLLFLTPAVVLHTSPRFPGSLAGGLLGIAAATLMALLLIYPIVKYSAPLKAIVIRLVPLRALLGFHVYAGVLGGLLGVLHTGHKYQSPLGIALVIAMLVVVATGFAGRYYLPKLSTGLREQQSQLATLRSAYDRTADDLARRQVVSESTPTPSPPAVPALPVLQLVDGIADLEDAIGAREVVKTIFVRWIVAHVLAAIAMYLLLTLHVAGEIYYGLRWLP